jgi:hypothetical protein
LETQEHPPRSQGARPAPAGERSCVDFTVVANYFPIAIVLTCLLLIRIAVAILAGR